jgi:hypothetical protein
MVVVVVYSLVIRGLYKLVKEIPTEELEPEAFVAITTRVYVV